jgi:hypothetical protein
MAEFGNLMMMMMMMMTSLAANLQPLQDWQIAESERQALSALVVLAEPCNNNATCDDAA